MQNMYIVSAFFVHFECIHYHFDTKIDCPNLKFEMDLSKTFIFICPSKFTFGLF